MGPSVIMFYSWEYQNPNQGNNANFTVNGTSWVPPDVPVLLQILSGVHSAQDLLPKGSIYPVNANDTVELVFPGVKNAGTNVSEFSIFYMHITNDFLFVSILFISMA